MHPMCAPASPFRSRLEVRARCVAYWCAKGHTCVSKGFFLFSLLFEFAGSYQAFYFWRNPGARDRWAGEILGRKRVRERQEGTHLFVCFSGEGGCGFYRNPVSFCVLAGRLFVMCGFASFVWLRSRVWCFLFSIRRCFVWRACNERFDDKHASVRSVGALQSYFTRLGARPKTHEVWE